MTEAEAAQECAAIYTALANGKLVNVLIPEEGKWKPCLSADTPTVARIRRGVKYMVHPEPPETVWAVRSRSHADKFHTTTDESVAEGWRDDGLTVYGYELAGTSFRTP
jgi:hypothetical protein